MHKCIVLLKVIIIVFFLGLIMLVVYGVALSEVQITSNNIPIYPNSQGFTINDTTNGKNAKGIIGWSFKTEDDPQTVWNYYKTLFITKWAFRESSNNNYSYGLLEKHGCPAYELFINSSEKVNNYNIINLIISKYPCPEDLYY